MSGRLVRQPTGVERQVRIVHGVFGFNVDDLLTNSFQSGDQALQSLFGSWPAQAIGAERYEPLLEPLGQLAARIPRQMCRVLKTNLQQRFVSGSDLPP